MQVGGAVRFRNYSFLMSEGGQQAARVDWAQLFQDPTLPLVADLGCGAGRYVLLMAHRKGRSKNYLGVDIHKALLERANGWASARGLSGNVQYLQANAVVSAGALLDSYPGPIELVSVQYPDPQQRRRRHMVGRELVAALASVLQPGARVYLNSDFEDTATFMRNCFERYGSTHFDIDRAAHAPEAVFPCSPFMYPVRPDVLHRRGNAAPAATTTAAASGSGTEGLVSGGIGEASPSGVPAPGAASSWDSSLSEASGGEESCSDGDGDVGDLLYFEGSWQEAGWLVDNPVGAPTEREVYVEKATKGRVYRVLLTRR